MRHAVPRSVQRRWPIAAAALVVSVWSVRPVIALGAQPDDVRARWVVRTT